VNPRIRVGGATFPNERVRSSEDLLREAHRSYRALQGTSRTLFEAEPLSLSGGAAQRR
jgi:hypothetical protein